MTFRFANLLATSLMISPAFAGAPSAAAPPESNIQILAGSNEPNDVDPNAIYSNITHFVDPALIAFNGGATDANPRTNMVCDDLHPADPGAFARIDSFSFSIYSGSASSAFTAPIISFYAADGTTDDGNAGAPGTFIGDGRGRPLAIWEMISTYPSYVNFHRLFVPMTPEHPVIWACMAFSAGGPDPANADELNQLGLAEADPPDVGTSEDHVFIADPTQAGVDHPVGHFVDYAAAPIANVGWELVGNADATLPPQDPNWEYLEPTHYQPPDETFPFVQNTVAGPGDTPFVAIDSRTLHLERYDATVPTWINDLDGQSDDLNSRLLAEPAPDGSIYMVAPKPLFDTTTTDGVPAYRRTPDGAVFPIGDATLNAEASFTTLTVASSGRVMVGVQLSPEDIVNGPYALAVFAYQNDAWSQIGPAVETEDNFNDLAASPMVAEGPDGSLYVATISIITATYGLPVVYKYDAEANRWNLLGGTVISNESPGINDYPMQISVDANSNVIVAWATYVYPGESRVSRFDGSSWSYMAPFDQGAIANLPIGHMRWGPDGKLYLLEGNRVDDPLYDDGIFSNVMLYVMNDDYTWNATGITAPFCDAWDIDSIGRMLCAALVSDYNGSSKGFTAIRRSIIPVDPAPRASANPTPLNLTVSSGAMTSGTLNVTNFGSANTILDYTIDIAPTSCDAPAPVAWLSIAPAAGAVPAPEIDVNTVTIDASALDPGVVTAFLCVRSDDAVNPVLSVPVTVTVTPQTTPQVMVTPSSLTFSVQAGHTTTAPLTIANTGEAGTTLNYTVDMAASSCDQPSSVAWLAIVPNSGAIVSGESETATVTVDAAMLDPGNVTAQLCVRSDDPVNPVVQIPVDVTVTPAADNDDIFKDGFDEPVPPQR